MSTLTKEWLLKTIAELEEERDALPGAVNEDAAMALAAMKLALASLESDGAAEFQHDWSFGGLNKLQSQKQCVKCGRVELVAPPAPVDVLDDNAITQHFDTIALETAREIMCDVNRRHEFLGGEVQLLSRIQCRIDDACRTAMLHGAEPVTTAYKLPAIGWLRADYQDDNRGLRGNAPLFVLGKKDPSTVWGLDYIPLTSNSPVIPDGVCPCCGRKQLKNRTCSVSGCDGKHVARGFCVKHYALERKKDPSRRESIRAADKRYRARKAAAPQQEA